MKREVKIGIFAVTMLVCAWAGIRFLSGIDIFSRNVDYYAAYDQINGVQAASPIMIKGVKVGSVSDISFDEKTNNVVLRFTVKRQYRIPTNSEAKIYSNGIMGSKAIEIILGDNRQMLVEGDTIPASRDRDIMDVAGSELEFFKQKVSQIVADLSRTMNNLNSIMESNATYINGTMGHLNSITANVDGLLLSERNNLQGAVDNLSRFTTMLGRNSARMDSIIGNTDRFTRELAEADVARNLDSTLVALNATIAKINSGDGTLGLLLNDKHLYESLNQAGDNLASLLADVENNPKRYVHFSLFGRSDKRDAKQAQKAVVRAERDSLKRADK